MALLCLVPNVRSNSDEQAEESGKFDDADVVDVLCRWERLNPIDNLKRIRQKIRKLVQKYTKLQQQPAILILNCEMAQKGLRTVSLQSPKAPNEISGDSVGLLKDVLGLAQFSDKERPMWYSKIWLLLMLKELHKTGGKHPCLMGCISTNLKLCRYPITQTGCSFSHVMMLSICCWHIVDCLMQLLLLLLPVNFRVR
ncbi:hypothetical protein ACOSQ4_020328 [Xanthoceras sorbifolium]